MDGSAMSTRRRAGLTKQSIVHQAVTLSEQVGVEGWSIRDIAQQLGVVPSVIYHYYPGKEALCDAVVDQICRDIRIPDMSLEWKEWFFAAALQARPVLLRYVGVTDRLARGKFTESWLPMLDAACEKLLQAGFGDRTALAYVIILNAVIHTIGAHNLRSTHQVGERHDVNATLNRFAPMVEKSPGLRLMVSNYLKPLAQPETENELSERYFDLVMAATLDGVEHVLLNA